VTKYLRKSTSSEERFILVHGFPVAFLAWGKAVHCGRSIWLSLLCSSGDARRRRGFENVGGGWVEILAYLQEGLSKQLQLERT
jgi:hypothetical protein